MALRAKRKSIKPEEFVTGVPNLDIEEEEYRGLTKDQRRRVRESGLWDVKTDKEMRGEGADTSTDEEDEQAEPVEENITMEGPEVGPDESPTPVVDPATFGDGPFTVTPLAGDPEGGD